MKNQNHDRDASILEHRGGTHPAPKPLSKSKRRRIEKDLAKLRKELLADPHYNDHYVLSQLTGDERVALCVMHSNHKNFTFKARHITIEAQGDLVIFAIDGVA